MYETKKCYDDNAFQCFDFSRFSKEDLNLKYLFYIAQALGKWHCDIIESKHNYLIRVLNSASEKYAQNKTIDAEKERSIRITNQIKSLIRKRDKALASYVEEASKKIGTIYRKRKLRNSVASEIAKAKGSYYGKRIKNVGK